MRSGEAENRFAGFLAPIYHDFSIEFVNTMSYASNNDFYGHHALPRLIKITFGKIKISAEQLDFCR